VVVRDKDVHRNSLQNTLYLRGIDNYTLVKGLEGSLDLIADRIQIIALSKTGLRYRSWAFINLVIGGPLRVPDTCLSESTPQLPSKQLCDVIKGKPSKSHITAVWMAVLPWRCELFWLAVAKAEVVYEGAFSAKLIQR
jgi:hypothetical protein